jgi:hypothetical protein
MQGPAQTQVMVVGVRHGLGVLLASTKGAPPPRHVASLSCYHICSSTQVLVPSVYPLLCTCRTASTASPSTTLVSPCQHRFCRTHGSCSPSTDPCRRSPCSSCRSHACLACIPGAAAAGLRRAEPFSLGIQWDAYYNNPATDMPGYPAGYRQIESSPFASMASYPSW